MATSDGVLADEFLWVGNHPATDLCNTVPVIGGVVVELLPDHDAILRWATAIGITAPAAGAPAREQRHTTRFVHDLRSAVRDALLPGLAQPHALAVINDLLAGEPGVLHVSGFGEESRANVSLTSTTAPGRFRLALAAEIVDIFDYSPTRIRKCARPDCVLLFLDTSKSGKRRWCDMSTCGNRTKAAAHYARTRSP
jgi:predicted RNA-binding Zn ribbon-like protein